MYTELQPALILDTLHRLRARIDEHFPGSGLSRVAAELAQLAGKAGPTTDWLNRPIWPLRVGGVLGVAGILGVAIGFSTVAVRVSLKVDGVADLLQASEAAVNEVILLSLAIFFLLSLETRVKRSRALNALHRLRSIVHVVDMHQLTKDPQDLLAGAGSRVCPPKRSYTRLELARYLDFCTELLSLASKLAALHVQYLNDPVVLGAVNDIETVAASLSNKIWQKIMILDVMVPGERRGGGRFLARARRGVRAGRSRAGVPLWNLSPQEER